MQEILRTTDYNIINDSILIRMDIADKRNHYFVVVDLPSVSDKKEIKEKENAMIKRLRGKAHWRGMRHFERLAKPRGIKSEYLNLYGAKRG